MFLTTMAGGNRCDETAMTVLHAQAHNTIARQRDHWMHRRRAPQRRQSDPRAMVESASSVVEHKVVAKVQLDWKRQCVLMCPVHSQTRGNSEKPLATCNQCCKTCQQCQVARSRRWSQNQSTHQHARGPSTPHQTEHWRQERNNKDKTLNKITKETSNGDACANDELERMKKDGWTIPIPDL